MASSYSTRLKLTLPATGELLNTWGATLDSGTFQLTDDAIAGYVTVDVSSVVVTLTTNQGATDQDRMAMVQINGTLTSGVGIVVTSVSKLRVVKNNTSGSFAVTMKTLGGLGTVIPQGTTLLLACDGVSVFPITSPVSSTPAIYAYLSSDQTFTGNNTFGVTVAASGIALTGPAFSPYVTLTDGTSIAINMSKGINFVVTLGGNRTLEAPTVDQPGQSGTIVICQDATGSRTLSFASAWLFAGGTDPTMSTSVSAIDALWYQVYTSTKILAGTANLFS